MFLKNKLHVFWSIWKVFYDFLESLDGDSFVELMDIEMIWTSMLLLYFFQIILLYFIAVIIVFC